MKQLIQNRNTFKSGIAIVAVAITLATYSSANAAKPAPIQEQEAAQQTYPPQGSLNVLFLNGDGSFHFAIVNIQVTTFLDIEEVFVGWGTDLVNPAKWTGATLTGTKGVYLLMVAGGPTYTIKFPANPGGPITWKNSAGGSGTLVAF